MKINKLRQKHCVTRFSDKLWTSYLYNFLEYALTDVRLQGISHNQIDLDSQ